jgi:hypothetical protein
MYEIARPSIIPSDNVAHKVRMMIMMAIAMIKIATSSDGCNVIMTGV